MPVTQSEEKASSLDSEVCYHIVANQIDLSFCSFAIDLFCLVQDSLPQNETKVSGGQRSFQGQ